jgi:hypothetical protein
MSDTRIPDYVAGMASRELELLGRRNSGISATDIIEEMRIHAGGMNENAATCLAWAIQIHEVEKLPMGECIDAAMIFLFG